MSARPIFIGAGTPAASTGAISVGYPSAWRPGDLLILLVESSNEAVATPTGWTPVADSPQGTGTAATADATRITAFYRRALDSDSGSVLVADAGNHLYGVVLAHRGVIETGDPWDVTSGGTEATVDTSVSIGGDTTTIDNTLVLVACARAADISTPEFASWANADLADLAEVTDDGSTTGDGGGIAAAIGWKDTAGAYGSTTATLTTASAKAYLTIALRPARGPWLFGRGVINGTVLGSQGYSWSPAGAYQADDVALLLVESSNEAVATPSGWATVTDSPQGTGTGGAADATRLTMFWKRAASGAEADVTVTNPGDHIVGQLLVFRNCATTGDPWDVTSGGVKAAASTAMSVAGVTTTVDDTLIVIATTRDNDLASAHFSSWANAGLSSGVYEAVDAGGASGNGGGFGVAMGTLVTAGASGTTTATISVSVVEGFMTIALRPPTASESHNGSATIGHASATSASGRKGGRGLATITHASASAATGRKSARGVATIGHSSATSATGRKDVRGPAASATAASAVSASGRKGAHGSFSVAHVSATSASGTAFSPAHGSFAVTHASSTSASGRKHARGVATVAHTSATSATGRSGRRGTFVVAHASTTSASGRHGASGAASVAHTSATSASGHKGARGSTSVTHTSATSATGRVSTPTAGAFELFHVSSTSASGHKSNRATVAITHTSSTSASGHKGARGVAAITSSSSVSASARKGARGAATLAIVSGITVVAHSGRFGSFVVNHAAAVTTGGHSIRPGHSTSTVSGPGGRSTVEGAGASGSTIEGQNRSTSEVG